MKKRQKGLRLRGMIWWISITVNSKQYQFSTGTTDYKTALKIYYKMRNSVTEGRWFEKMVGEFKTCRNLLDKYLKEVSLRKAPQSHRRDKSLAAHLMEKVGGHALLKTTPQVISDYKNSRKQEGAAPQTINHELALLGHAFNIAVREWEWVRDNPVARVSKEKVDNIRDRCLSDEEEQRLLAESPEWLQEIIVYVVKKLLVACFQVLAQVLNEAVAELHEAGANAPGHEIFKELEPQVVVLLHAVDLGREEDLVIVDVRVEQGEVREIVSDRQVQAACVGGQVVDLRDSSAAAALFAGRLEKSRERNEGDDADPVH